MTGYWFSLSDESDCTYAISLQHFVEAILEHFRQTGVAASQLEQVLDSLEAYKETLAHAMDTHTLHFSASQGGHRCLDTSYQEGVITLQLLLLTPEPEPPEPPPPQPQMTLEEVVKGFGEPVQPYDEGSYIGTDDDEQDDW